MNENGDGSSEEGSLIEITESLVAQLVGEQFPQWGDLPVREVPRQGWDNRTFRLGDELSVRLPSHEAYAAAVPKEARALAFLDGRLPVAVPTVVAVGEPGHDFLFAWSVRRWLDGVPVGEAPGSDQADLASGLGAALRTLRSLPTEAGTAAGRHSF